MGEKSGLFESSARYVAVVLNMYAIGIRLPAEYICRLLALFPQHGLCRFEVQFGDRPQPFLSMFFHDHTSSQFNGR